MLLERECDLVAVGCFFGFWQFLDRDSAKNYQPPAFLATGIMNVSVLKVEFGLMDHSICYRIENTGKTCSSLGRPTSSLTYLVFYRPEKLSMALLNLIWSQVQSILGLI